MRGRAWTYIALVAPLVWFFGGILWRGEVLDFRDIAHYYRPLWQWTSGEWAAGRVPLWCDLDGLGMPVHADPTASIFYPGQIVFALPCPFTARLNLYVALHVLLAAVLLYRTARAFGASRAGAVGGALAYAYGGHVLFQYCNPIYLVGAAWLPLAVLACERVCSRGSWRWMITLAVALALMILGGDVQSVYNVGLLALLLLWLKRRDRGPGVSSRRPLALIAAGGALACALAAVQLLPSLQWSARSERAIVDAPRSVWELHKGENAAQGMLGEPLPNTHHERIYEFSVGPWRWLEFVWPNIGGKMFPIHHRWMTALPAEGRVWSPSLYLGFIPLAAALFAFSVLRRADATTRWLSWMLLFGLLGSLGIYGLGWLWNELRYALDGNPQPKQPFGALGGLYWWLVTLLPGYVQFRYPAKLMVFASLGLALLAARGWDSLWTQPCRSLRRALVACFAGSVIIGVAVRRSENWLGAAPAEFPFGELSIQGAIQDVVFAALQTAILALILLLLLPRRIEQSTGHVWAVLLTIVDLCVANSWMISATPQAEIDKPVVIRQELPAPPIHRIYRGAANVTDDVLPPDIDRLAQVNLWERATLAEKTALGEGYNLANMTSALEPADLAAVWRQIDRQDAVLAPLYSLGVDARLDPAPHLLSPQWTRLRSFGYYNPVYVVGDIEHSPPLADNDRQAMSERTRSVFYPNGEPLDRRIVALVESDEPPGDVRRRGQAIYAERIRRKRTSPTHNTVWLELTSARLLVLTDYYAPGWECSITDEATGVTTSAKIYRTNRVLRGVVVPAGKQRVTFVYRPYVLYAGAVISAFTWTGVLAMLVAAGTRRRKSL